MRPLSRHSYTRYLQFQHLSSCPDWDGYLFFLLLSLCTAPSGLARRHNPLQHPPRAHIINLPRAFTLRVTHYGILALQGQVSYAVLIAIGNQGASVWGFLVVH